jgi:mycothiol S-conjugate amidase
VHAHPDDESSKGAATLARYAHDGVDVVVATMTGGERGDILNPRMDRQEVRDNLIELRRQEVARACAILGVTQRSLGFVDSGMPQDGPPPEGSFAAVPLATAAEPLVRLVREFRPHVLITYDERGGYPHPDHIRSHEVSVEAFAAAADPARYPGTGEPWQPLKLYYQGAYSKEYFQAIYDAMTAAGLDSPHGEVVKGWDDSQPTWEITTRVPCAEYFPVRRQAMLAHETQVDPDGPVFSCPIELEQRAWPTEDYHLARSVVEAPLPENDLFAGIAASGS